MSNGTQILFLEGSKRIITIIHNSRVFRILSFELAYGVYSYTILLCTMNVYEQEALPQNFQFSIV